jgi:hypothetical protein
MRGAGRWRACGRTIVNAQKGMIPELNVWEKDFSVSDHIQRESDIPTFHAAVHTSMKVMFLISDRPGKMSTVSL